jgi:hypothetical protein
MTTFALVACMKMMVIIGVITFDIGVKIWTEQCNWAAFLCSINSDFAACVEHANPLGLEKACCQLL